jgi:hypothetical protein
MMKVGDLVGYAENMRGMHDCLGIVVGYNGEAIDVQWIDKHSARSNRRKEISSEMPMFLRLVSSAEETK